VVAPARQDPDVAPQPDQECGVLTVGHHFSKTVTFDEASIRAFAEAAGDGNPLHHDAAFAEASRFGGIIASGTHHGALMMGLVATELTKFGAGVGLEFGLSFRKPLPAGATVRLEWEVTANEPAPRLRGTIAHLAGKVTDVADGTVVMTTTGKCLMLDTPPTAAEAAPR
jgi:3-hydroxybutyryl-CoA dehydratase